MERSINIRLGGREKGFKDLLNVTQKKCRGRGMASGEGGRGRGKKKGHSLGVRTGKGAWRTRDGRSTMERGGSGKKQGRKLIHKKWD